VVGRRSHAARSSRRRIASPEERAEQHDQEADGAGAVFRETRMAVVVLEILRVVLVQMSRPQTHRGLWVDVKMKSPEMAASTRTP
jgi:hypothetical protein